MDTVNGLPALLDSDPASTMGQYSRDLRTFLRGRLAQAGSTSVTLSSSVQGTQAVTFPFALPAVPVVVGNVVNAGYSPPLIVYITGVSTTGFTINLVNASGNSGSWTRTVNWLAMVPLP